MAGPHITTDLDEIDLDVVHRWLSTDAFWAIGRSRGTVEQAARFSLNFGALDPDGGLIGYARVVTDYTTFGWLCDVYVPLVARGRGVGLTLAIAVADRLRPMKLTRVLLSTSDAHELYVKVGFERLGNSENLMRLSEKAL